MADKPAAKPGGKPEAKPGGAKKHAAPPPPAGFKITVAEAIVAAILILILFFVLGFATSSAFSDMFSGILRGIKIVSTVVSMIAILIIIYSFIRINELSAEENKKLGLTLNWEREKSQKNVRWERVEKYMTSLNSSDWKVAILEADNILDDIVERMGYKGAGLGERMKNISATDFPYLEEAWEAHKIRNALAHKGTDYELTRSDAEHVINLYHRIFAGLRYL